ncbi:hypothetical protein OG306_15565 [Streptomyces sp. NBC_01241]|uniref:hypothetical protein n=1 Tax=Streptomyces sp. NBC_01241 TaxID=2903794 RepID=UPI00352E65E8|nr:hypothetical protein OG306_15565 [Streptomyces sp. NBC_01241]
MNIDLVDWASIAADGFPFPEGVPASRLAAELSAMLVSADPEIRDDYAYTGVAQWIKEGHFDEVLQALGDTAATRFSHPEVQARTFAPLVLCSVLTRGNAVPGLVPKEAVERWFARFSTWYLAENRAHAAGTTPWGGCTPSRTAPTLLLRSRRPCLTAAPNCLNCVPAG